MIKLSHLLDLSWQVMCCLQCFSVIINMIKCALHHKFNFVLSMSVLLTHSMLAVFGSSIIEVELCPYIVLTLFRAAVLAIRTACAYQNEPEESTIET